jgi:hypothetical protein
VDAARWRAGKRSLLPLRFFETRELKWPFELFVSAYQRPNIGLKVCLYVGFMGFGALLTLVDWIVADFLVILKVDNI